ncbi:MAG: carbohydrate ABC transporter permease [Candidatus Bathyarchaeia archaeon]
MGTYNKRDQIIKTSLLILVGLVFFSYTFPFYMISILAFGANAFANPPEFFPREIRVSGFLKIISHPDFLRWVGNSFLYATLITVGAIILSSLFAYAITRYNFPGKEMIFWLVLLGMMVPGVVIYVPIYYQLSRLGLINTYIGIIVPPMSSAYSAFLLKQAFESVPRDYDEAASIDGAGTLTTLFRIILPIAKPALITTALFNWVINWNNFAWPLLVLTTSDKYPLVLGILYMGLSYTIDYEMIASGVLVCMLPCVIIYLIGIDYFMRGVVVGGLKK